MTPMLLAVVLSAQAQAQPAPPALAWTWALYEDQPVVLAEEITDTARLRTTLECAPGSGVARLSLYDVEPAQGFMRLTAGDSTATGEVVARAGAVSAAAPVNHPAFARFVADGRMSVALGGQTRSVEVPRPHLAKLRRFAELCAG